MQVTNKSIVRRADKVLEQPRGTQPDPSHRHLCGFGEGEGVGGEDREARKKTGGGGGRGIGSEGC